MSEPQNAPTPIPDPAVEQSEHRVIEVEGPGDTTMRPVSPEQIAAVKRLGTPEDETAAAL